MQQCCVVYCDGCWCGGICDYYCFWYDFGEVVGVVLVVLWSCGLSGCWGDVEFVFDCLQLFEYLLCVVWLFVW